MRETGVDDNQEMPDSPESVGDSTETEWDAAEVMGRRAVLAREQRDRSLAELREAITDEQALEQFGIDLREIER